ncbi:unnamed protein product, partial [Gulo gulo]
VLPRGASGVSHARIQQGRLPDPTARAGQGHHVAPRPQCHRPDVPGPRGAGEAVPARSPHPGHVLAGPPERVPSP